MPSSATRRRPLNPYVYAYAFAAALFCGQIATGTRAEFAFLVLLFTITWLHAFKAAGEFKTLMGICIAFFGCQQVVVSQVAKVLFAQSADKYLFRPIETMEVYDLSIFGILLGVMAVRAILRLINRPLFIPETNPVMLMRLSVVTTALSIVHLAITHIYGTDATSGDLNTGGVIGPIRQLIFAPYLAVAACTAYAVTSSGGKRCLFWLSYIAIGVPVVFGLISCGRWLSVSAIVVWVISAVSFGYQVKKIYWTYAGAFGVFAYFVLSPLALYARNVARTPNFARNISMMADAFVDFFHNPDYYRNLGYDRLATVAPERQHYWYYGSPNSVLDRFSLVCTADGIVDATINYGTIGWETISPAFEMLLPRFLAPDKQATTTQNLLAHRTPGLIGKNDTGTGVALGFSCDAFSSFGWCGVPLVAFILTLCLFGGHGVLMNLNLRQNIYAIAIVGNLIWQFSDANIATVVTESILGMVELAVTFYAVNYVARRMNINFNTSLR